MASELKAVGEFMRRFAEIRAARADKAPEVDAAVRGLEASAEASRRANWPRHLAACDVPPQTVAVLTGTGLMREAVALGAVAAWARGAKAFCVLWGGNGTGKTVAGASALWWARKTISTHAHEAAETPTRVEELSSRKGLFVTAFNLRHMSQRDWQAKQEGRAISFETALEVPWLVVDELGHEGEDARGEWKARLRELINARHANRLRTVITSNCHPWQAMGGYPALATWVGPAAADRLAQDADVVEVGGASMRRGPPKLVTP